MAQAGKPDILVIRGDAIGVWNLACYHHGTMGGRTLNIDRIAAEGALLTDCHGQQSCTVGRTAFITGQHPFRTGLLRVGLPDAELGVRPRGSDHCRPPEEPRLRDRAVRQEPRRRPQRMPAQGMRQFDDDVGAR